MLSKTIQDAMNEQISAETYSSYLYLSMAAHCDEVNLKGFSHWFRIQVDEERAHMMKMFDFVLERGGKVDLQAIDAPTASWESPLAVFEATLAHEQMVTARINKLVDLALAESDHATNAFLQWFVSEQVEEEATADAIRQELTLMQDAPGALYMLDRDLAKRARAAPAGDAGAGG